jgi:hypothetical protein
MTAALINFCLLLPVLVNDFTPITSRLLLEQSNQKVILDGRHVLEQARALCASHTA